MRSTTKIEIDSLNSPKSKTLVCYANCLYSNDSILHRRSNANKKELYILVHFLMLMPYKLHGLLTFATNEKNAIQRTIIR